MTSLEGKMIEKEKSRSFDSKSLEDIRKRQDVMDKALSSIQKTQDDRNKAENRVQSNLIEMKCLELKNNLLFFSIDELTDEAEREDERCESQS